MPASRRSPPLVFDLDRIPPDPERLAGVCWIGHTTWSHRPETPRWRVVIPLARPVPAAHWSEVWQRTRAALCPEADPSCKDPSRQYYLPSHPPGIQPQARCHAGRLLDPATLPELPPELAGPEARRLPTAVVPREPTERERRRGEAYMTKVIADLAKPPAGGRNHAFNRAAWKLGQWVAAGALDQAAVEAEHNGLVSDPKDGPRQTWATIRSGLSAGLQQPKDLDADERRAPRRGEAKDHRG